MKCACVGASLDDGLLEVLYAMDLSNEQVRQLTRRSSTGSQSIASVRGWQTVSGGLFGG